MTIKSISDDQPAELISTGRNLEDIHSLRRRALNYVLYIAVALGAVLLFLRLPGMIQGKQWLPLAAIASVYIVLFIATFSPERFYNFRLITLIVLLYGLSSFALFQSGLFGDGRLYLLAFVLCINGLTDWVYGLSGTALATLTMVIVSILYSTEILKYSFAQNQITPTGLDWAFAVFTFIVISLLVTILFMLLSRSHDRNFALQRSAIDDAAKAHQLLAQSETDHARQLQKQNSQVEVAGQIAREIAAQSDSSSILDKAIDLIQNNFGFYHVGIFMLDGSGEFAVLKGASSEAGRQMLANKHRLRVGEEGIVGYAIKQGEAHIALDVGSDAVHFKNPLLPETRSEMALPLISGSKTIGALDVQSQEEAAFTTQDIKVLQIVADQLAFALERADLVTQLQQTVDELQAGYQTFTQSAWQSFLKKSGKIHSIQIARGKEDVNIPEPVDVAEAKNKNRPLILSSKSESGDQATTAIIPIKLRDQSLGSIRIQFNSTVIPVYVMEFIQTASDRLALSLENARLLEEIGDRAEQEHLVREISEKVTSSPDISEILRTAASELGKSLGATSVRVVLKPKQKEQSAQ